MKSPDSDTQQLLRRACRGDREAEQRLLDRHRDRLRRMVAVRMDTRLSPRVDPSDVVQEALLDASRQLSDYARQPPLPFYPWLRQLAWQRLVDVHHRHVTAQKRSVAREVEPRLPDESVMLLADQLIDRGSSPSVQLLRKELRERVQSALADLKPSDREVLVMRHLEQMSIGEIAATLELSESAVKMRRLRAIQRLRQLLDSKDGKSPQ